MELKELLKYIDIIEINKETDVSILESINFKIFEDYGEKFTLIIGHQPSFKDGILNTEDPYWTDNIMEPLNIKVLDLNFSGTNLYDVFDVKIGKNNYDIVLQDDNGFVVGYSSINLYNTIQKERNEN
jgi:hypothetical protein